MNTPASASVSTSDTTGSPAVVYLFVFVFIVLIVIAIVYSAKQRREHQKMLQFAIATDPVAAREMIQADTAREVAHTQAEEHEAEAAAFGSAIGNITHAIVNK